MAAFPLLLGVEAVQARDLTFEDRVEAQQAIERVYWAHRIWPRENPQPKPSFERIMSKAVIRAKVEDDLEKASALEALGHWPITHAQLRAERDRMERHSRAPEVLRELFAALGNDPSVIAETLARPLLVNRLLRSTDASARSYDASNSEAEAALATDRHELSDPLGCLPDTWSPSVATPPAARYLHTAVWTGAEMIVWGGSTQTGRTNTGGRYDPATDTWTETSTGTNVPAARSRHTAVWTGTEMIIWGGYDTTRTNTGGRYDPSTDTWTPTSTGANVPQARENQTAVWTGTEMIVWGGKAGLVSPELVTLNTGGRYNPSTDTWTATSTGEGVAGPREAHVAVWTGTEMIVWGGGRTLTSSLNTGGRYNLSTDTWTPTSTGANVPSPRVFHTAVWTGTEVIVWGGTEVIHPLGQGPMNTGARYNPSTNTWATTSTAANVPLARWWHTAVFTGAEMIVWGGEAMGGTALNTGARYEPIADTWIPTSLGTNVPAGRYRHTAVWTGTQMLVWGGEDGLPVPGNVGLYCGCLMHPDGIPMPSGHVSLTETKSGVDAVLSWTVDPGATDYDAVKGSLAELLGSGGDFATSTSGCLGSNLSGTTVSDAEVPAPGSGVWHLVRAVNSCSGNGSYNEWDSSQQGSRDAEIQASEAACP